MDGKRPDPRHILAEARRIGLTLDESRAALLARYCRLLEEWNARLNLVSRKDIGNLVPGHIMDSLSALPVVKELLGGNAAPRAMDLGSGGGLPGLPLKICYPNMLLVCVESTRKKAMFLETAIKELGLAGAAIIDKRSREIEKVPEHRGQYELVTARAVAPLKDLVRLAFPFLKPGGRLLAFKAARAERELKEARAVLTKMNGQLERTISTASEGSGKKRTILVLQKMPGQ